MTCFQCKNCKYRFELKTERIPRSCPYCGKIGSISKEASAEDIIEEIKNMQKD